MDSVREPYSKDTYSDPLYANVSWSRNGTAPMPIALVYHAGGLMVGSADIVPKTQTEYLCSKGFVVIAPNYRLIPQVTGKEAFEDCARAYDWAVSDLPKFMQQTHAVQVDSSRVVAMGHSVGGTLAMHAASCKMLKAATAFYPTLFLADQTTSGHRPTSAPPFGMMPDFEPTEDDMASIQPAGVQLSEFQMALPGTVPQARNRWQGQLLKHGQWTQHVQPDGDFAAVDPMTRLSAQWPPVMIVQGEADDIPGSGLDLAQRAEREMKAAGVKAAELVVVPGEKHMFDMPPTVGTTDQGAKWQAVVKGLDWLVSHV